MLCLKESDYQIEWGFDMGEKSFDFSPNPFCHFVYIICQNILFRRNLPFYRMQQSIIDLVFYLCSLFILHVCIKIEILPTSFWWAECWAAAAPAYLQNEDWNQRSHLTRIPYDNIIRVFYSFFSPPCPGGTAQNMIFLTSFLATDAFVMVCM